MTYKSTEALAEVKPHLREFLTPLTPRRTGTWLENHGSAADGDIPRRQIASEPAAALHFCRRGIQRTGLPERCGEMHVKPVRFSRGRIVHRDSQEIVTPSSTVSPPTTVIDRILPDTRIVLV